MSVDEAAIVFEPDAPPPAEAGPVALAERVAAVDTLRGVALLGILAMNIVAFAWPGDVYGTPTLAPGHTWADLALWMFCHVVFDTKMMTIFSMLFGAGLVLMSDRAESRGVSLRRIYYRRVFVLLLIGLVHSYLIWYGDILVLYASCGLFLYPFRRKSPTTLIVVGMILLLMIFPAWAGIRAGARFMAATASEVDAQVEAGKTPVDWKKGVRDSWRKIEEKSAFRPDKFREEIRIHRGDYAGIVAERAEDVFEDQTFGFLLGGWWLVGGRMLLGMGLMKLGVFSAARSDRFYRRMMAIGYGVGLPLVLIDIAIDWHHHFFTDNGLGYITGGWWLVEMVSGPLLAIGHVAAVMMIVRAGWFAGLMARLAAVGRMALSNYLFDSIVCTTLFYGYGFGLFGRLLRPGLAIVVLSIWAFQLWFSPIWLGRFRYGPAEWAWRSLTYGKAQSFRR